MSGHRKDEAAMWDVINDSFGKMTFAQKRLWEIVRVLPTQWAYKTRSSLEGKVWIVAIIGEHVIWYDDFFGEMDDGFCISEYDFHGNITDKGTIGDDLQQVVEVLRLKISNSDFG